MKKFVLKVLLFFACVVVMDLAFGQIFSYLRTHAKGGSTANCEYIANRCKDDIIILGSSRATHHYVPQIIEDSLGVTCYNCGEEGNGVVLAYGRLKMLTDRYKPQLVLYELTPGYDYGKAEPNSKYLGYLRAYYEKDGISLIFEDFDDDLSWLKMKSKMYQNNTRLLPNLLDNIICRDNNKGYEPLLGHIISESSKKITQKSSEMTIDSLKLSYLRKVCELCRNEQIPLYFFISPRFKSNDYDRSSYIPALSLCNEFNVPVYDYLYSSSISDNTSYFQDREHMNNTGAYEYTKLIIKEILDK